MARVKQATINFPAKQSVGSIYLAEKCFPHQRQWIGDAKGSVNLSIPESKNLGIALGQHGTTGLTSLPADESSHIGSLDFSASYFNEKTSYAAPELAVALPHLTEVRLDFLKVGVRELSSLRYFTELRTLWLTGTEITDDALEPLSGYGEIAHLVLKKTRITDSGIARLKNLEKLQTLNAPSQMTDEGLKNLAAFAALRRLDISYTRITDSGIRYLVGLNSLSELYLNDTNLSDSVIDFLSQMTSLKTIFLSGTKVTDTGISKLNGLANLEHLELRDTKTTDAGIAKLRNSLANCSIFGP